MSLNKLNSNFNSLPDKFSHDLEDQWASISNGKILVHDKNFKIVFERTTKMGMAKNAIFHKIPKRELIIV